MKTLGVISVAALFCFLAPGPAAAQGNPGVFQGWEALSAAELTAERGGESAEFADVNFIGMGAEVQDNTVVNSTSGDNLVSGGAFAGASGFSTIIQNSGNHVIIQNATIVNLTIEK